MNTTSQQNQTTAIATVTPKLPAAVERYGRTGAVIGTTQHFTGNLGAKDVKLSLKRSGLKGKELTAKVNEVLRGEKSVREQLGVAWVQATIQSGFIPDNGQIGKNTACLRFVKIAASAPVKAVALTADELAEQTAKANGMTIEEFRAIMAAAKK